MSSSEKPESPWKTRGVDQRETTFVHEYLLPWAESLPAGRAAPILDLAGGSGQESQQLAARGFDTVLVDLSGTLLRESNSTKRARADIFHLPLEKESVGGVLFKDLWIFLSPQNKQALLAELHRVLKPGGSALIFSQLGDAARVHYSPQESQYPQKETYRSDQEMMAALEKGAFSQDTVLSVEYCASAEEVVKRANQLGYQAEIVEKHKFDHPLAKENKWVQQSGFTVKLSKLV